MGRHVQRNLFHLFFPKRNEFRSSPNAKRTHYPLEQPKWAGRGLAMQSALNGALDRAQFWSCRNPVLAFPSAPKLFSQNGLRRLFAIQSANLFDHWDRQLYNVSLQWRS